ncbi:hypothetical protein [Mesorhizobium carmichaelinearum]|uniref:hypothetical protein n=1 Tax=Mesorhizobium carmichaelinearum TaxID=1208188 RepID=UPI000BA4A883|nr:hypothetical protein [Mesorhizobium carmichaelinearum]
MMIEEVSKPPRPDSGFVVRRLVDKTGITEPQAIEVIALLGLNWSSLVREAKLLNPRH